MDLFTLIILLIFLAMIAPFFKGLIKGLQEKPKVALKTKSVEPLIEVKLQGLSDPLSLPDIDLSQGFLTISSLDFFGQGSMSPNGKFIVGSQDFDYRGGVSGGHRDRGYGRVVLLEENKVLWQMDLARPNDAVVADNGNVAVNDWLFGEGLKGDFCIVNRNGKIFKYHCKANLDKCGISKDGSLAWCTTLSSEYEPDDCRTLVFSISPTALLFKLDGNFPPDEIYFRDDEIQIKKMGVVERYDYSGNLLNPEEVQEGFSHYTLEHGSPWELIELAKSTFYGKEKGKIAESDIREISKILEKVINTAVIDDNYRALAFRLQGELAEAQEDFHSAINHYRTALAYNPKVGVIRALARLEKRVGKQVQ